MNRPINVLLIDDHRVVSRGVQSFLESFPDIRVVASATSGEEALEVAVRSPADVAVVDLSMPGGMDGIETTRALRKRAPHTQVVVLTATSDDARLLAALRVGALGYVRKDADPGLLLEAVRAAAEGRSVVDPDVASHVLGDVAARRLPGQELTGREREVLAQLARGGTNREIARTLFVSEDTVKTHVANILGKLQLAHRTQAVVYALKHGLVSLDELSP